MKLPPVSHSGTLDRDKLEKAINDDESVGACLESLGNDGTNSRVVFDDTNAPSKPVKLVLSGESPPAKATPICSGDVILRGQKTHVSAYRLA